MAIPTIVDNNTVLTEMDSLTGLTSNATPLLATLAEFYVEPTGSVYYSMDNTGIEYYVYEGITNVDISSSYVWAWIGCTYVVDTKANGGCGIILSDGTNTVIYHVGGTDDYGFRHPNFSYWGSFVLNTTTLPSSFSVIAGSEASLNFAAITGIGISAAAAGAPGGFAIADVIRYGDQGISAYGGTSGDKIDFSGIATLNTNQINQGAYSVIHETANQVFEIQQKLKLGDDVETNDCYFGDSSATLTWFPTLVETGYNEIEIVGNATGTTDITWGQKSGNLGVSGVSVLCPAEKANFTATDTNIAQLNLYGCSFQNPRNVNITCSTEILSSSFLNYSLVTFDSSVTCNNTTFVSGVGLVTPAGATMDTTTIASSAATEALVLSSPSDCANMNNISFLGNDRAILITDNSNSTYNFDAFFFSGNTFDIRHSGSGDITINILNGGDTPTTEITGAGSVTINNSVTASVTCKDLETLSNIQDVRVFLKAASGGPLAVDTVILNDLTDASGIASVVVNFVSNQPVIGWARKASSDPRYKSSPISGTITSAGFSNTTLMIQD